MITKNIYFRDFQSSSLLKKIITKNKTFVELKLESDEIFRALQSTSVMLLGV